VPIACSTSALTGAEGLIQFQPAGTQFCLTGADLPAGNLVTVPANHDYRIGDKVKFTAEGTATLDSALPAGGVVKVIAEPDSTHIEIGDVNSGAPITLTGDSTGSTAADHIAIDISEFETVCQVREFSIEISREELDVTTLPCSVGAGSKFASFRATQAGYASGTGSMTVYFTADQGSLANRLLSNTLLKSQQGASIKLYVNAVSDGAGGINDAASLPIEADISITSMSLSVNPDDVTSAELSFSITNPKNILGAVLT